MSYGKPINPDAFYRQIANLRPGDTASNVRLVNPDATLINLPELLVTMHRQIGNAVRSSVDNAKALNKDARYRVDVGDMRLPLGPFYVVAVVTRTE